MSEQRPPLRGVHGRQLASYKRRGVKRVFLLVCDQPREECRAAARRVWPVHDAPDLPTTECPLAERAADGPWEGCLYAPYFGALVAVVD
jgi:hypothetical protein